MTAPVETQAQLISWRGTSSMKRAFFWGAVALIAIVEMPSVLDGSFKSSPLIQLTTLLILTGMWALFLRISRVFRIADEVVDCGDHLKVVFGKSEVIVPLSAIARVRAFTFFGMSRLSLGLADPIGSRSVIEFLPEPLSMTVTAQMALLANVLEARAKRAGEPAMEGEHGSAVRE